MQKILSVFFDSYVYIDKILNTSKGSHDYGAPMEMGSVSYVGSESCFQPGLVKISSGHTPSHMDFGKRCLAFSLLYSPLH